MTEEVDFDALARASINPKGYTILVAMPEQIKKIGSIIVTQDRSERESAADIKARVIALGPDAYGDKERFPTGPRCQEGDWIILRSYAGTRLRVKPTPVSPEKDGREYRLINDDVVEGVVINPDLIDRMF